MPDLTKVVLDVFRAPTMVQECIKDLYKMPRYIALHMRLCKMNPRVCFLCHLVQHVTLKRLEKDDNQ